MALRRIETFFHPNRSGQLLNVVKEHYLRDDIESGSYLDPDCSEPNRKLSAEADHYLIVDTNIILHQTDFLEHESVTDVIILSTVYREVRHKNISIFLRLKNILRNNQKRFFYFSNEFHKEAYVEAEANESPNDRNDRAIRVASLWYTKRIPEKQIILLTADAANLKHAQDMGIQAMSIKDYVSEKVHDSLAMDLVAWDARTDSYGHRKRKRKRIYNDFLSPAEVRAGIAQGQLFQGKFSISKHNYKEGKVERQETREGSDERQRTKDDQGEPQVVHIQGRPNMNRAFDGDVVVVKLLPQSQWGHSESGPANSRQADKAEQATGGVHVVTASSRPKLTNQR